MQITETGYYETRDGGLAYVIGIMPQSFNFDYPAMGVMNQDGDAWGDTITWKISGHEHGTYCNRKNDLIRYIGKELPEEKPQPERVELSKLWVIWERNYGGTLWRWSNYFETIEKAQEASRGQEIVAITPADATSFTIGENL